MNSQNFKALQEATERFKKINTIRLHKQYIDLSKCNRIQLIDLKNRIDREMFIYSKCENGRHKRKTLSMYLCAVNFSLSKIKAARTKKTCRK